MQQTETQEPAVRNGPPVHGIKGVVWSKHRRRLYRTYRGFDSILATAPRPWVVVAERRAKNKRAKISRRENRK
jgi:hypothetical protein